MAPPLEGRRLKVRSPAAVAGLSGHQADATIPAFVGQRLVIPCANTSSTRRQLAGSRNQKWLANGAKLLSSQSAPSYVPVNGQGISLISWYKDGQLDSPIFTVDARDASSLREAKQQFGDDETTLSGRAHFEESTRVDSRGMGSVPALVIDELTKQDVGLYTCSVEFKKEPTQTYKINVALMNPPRDLVIRDETARKLTHKVGPYEEDTPQTFTCEVEPGDPIGQVSWWQLESISSVVQGSPRAAIARAGAPQSYLMLNDRTHGSADGPKYLTTSSSGDDLGNQDDDSTATMQQGANYFVALYSNQSEQQNSVNSNLQLPFPNQRLKFWRRLANSTSVTVNSDDKLAAQLQVPMSRSNWGDEFLCLASNNDFFVPLNASIKINMDLKPTEVRILSKQEYAFRLNQKVTVQCQVQGSRPSAKIRWFRNSIEVDTASGNNNKSVESSEETREFARDINSLTRISYLTFAPKLTDNQQQLTCSAQNPRLSNLPAIVDSIVMNVQHPPMLSLKFGANLREDSMRIDSDIFMDCDIQTNPAIDGDLVWLHNDAPVQVDPSAGVLMHNQSLVIQRIKVEHRGKYQCLARNSLGETKSNVLELRPKFEPVCDYSRTKAEYRVAVDQSVRVECNVLAEPDEDINFTWRFNRTLHEGQENGGGGFHLEEIKQYETNFTSSSVMFTPKNKRHYGQLLCSASNAMGKQAKPCVILVLPSEIPDPVYSCFFDSQTASSFSVHCQAPASVPTAGGRLSYLLELFANESASLTETTATRAADSTHLRQKQKSGQQHKEEESGDEDGENDFEVDDNSDNDTGDSPSDQLRLRNQRRVRKITSDSPTFQVNNLEPSTHYTVLVYVQNAKGLSPPASYTASTLAKAHSSEPDVAESSLGKMHLYSRKSTASSLSEGSGEPLHEKLKSFLKFRDYLTISADNPKPMTGIALAVILSACSLVLVAFLVTRLCRRSRGARGIRKDSVAPVDQVCNKRLASVGNVCQHVSSSASSSSHGISPKNFTGSGSDTSRETNTDSALVSSPRPGGSCAATDPTMASRQVCCGGAPMAGVVNQWPIDQSRLFVNTPGQLSCAGGGQQPLLNMVAPQSIYSSVKRNHHHHQHNSNNNHLAAACDISVDKNHVSQVSIQSESDYASNIDVKSEPLTPRDVNQLVLSSCGGPSSEPVYVISRPGALESSYDQQHIRMVASPNPSQANGYWPCGKQQTELGEREFTFVSAVPQSINRCQVINNSVTQQQLNMPNSMSIPVSLNEHQHRQNRRYSQEFPMQNGANVCQISPLGHLTTSGSYLTLVHESPSSSSATAAAQFQPANAGWQPSYGYCYDSANINSAIYNPDDDQEIAANSISPPENFANIDALGGRLETAYCVQTLDMGASNRRQVRKKPGCLTNHRAERVQDKRRSSIDGVSGLAGSELDQGRQQHRVKFQSIENKDTINKQKLPIDNNPNHCL